jgi:hypothetical protein
MTPLKDRRSENTGIRSAQEMAYQAEKLSIFFWNFSSEKKKRRGLGPRRHQGLFRAARGFPRHAERDSLRSSAAA